jgi:hypothetical protein
MKRVTDLSIAGALDALSVGLSVGTLPHSMGGLTKSVLRFCLG